MMTTFPKISDLKWEICHHYHWTGVATVAKGRGLAHSQHLHMVDISIKILDPTHSNIATLLGLNALCLAASVKSLQMWSISITLLRDIKLFNTYTLLLVPHLSILSKDSHSQSLLPVPSIISFHNHHLHPLRFSWKLSPNTESSSAGV